MKLVGWAVVALLAAASAQAHGYRVLYSFCAQSNCADGSGPNGLIADASGNLYGTVYQGTTQGFGGIFELRRTRNGYSYNLLYGFCQQTNCADGGFPTGGLILDTSGNLYGTTEIGGSQGNGEVFELVRGKKGWTLELLYQFCPQGHDCTDGVGPDNSGLAYEGEESGVLYDGVSPLYGTTLGGGSTFNGVAYEISPGQGGWSFQVIYNFCSQQNCPDGAGPYATLTEDSSGNLYGTTLNGGASNAGTAFELADNGGSWSETVIYSFCSVSGCTDGAHPRGGLAFESSGNFSGQTLEGGSPCALDANGCGAAYTLTLGGAETVTHTFCTGKKCPDGANPQGALVPGANGGFYATTQYGGDFANDENGGGTLYSLNGSAFMTLYKFCKLANCADGALPTAAPTLDAKGRLFGTASNGGAHAGGVVYEFIPK